MDKGLGVARMFRFVWDVSKESFDFVIDKTIKDLYTVLGEAE